MTAKIIPFDQPPPPPPKPAACSFCGVPEAKAQHLFAGHSGAYICGACVRKAKGILDQPEPVIEADCEDQVPP